jgi:ATP-dependent Clp protease protease subunit
MAKFYSICRIKAQDGGSAGRVDIYGEISAVEFWGDEKTPSQFIADLNALGPVSEIEVHIFSPGGDPFAALAIYSEIKRRAETVNVYIDGIAASAATLILCAGDKVYMDETAMLMVHNPYQLICFTGMNAEAARELADELDKIREPMITAYMKKSGKTREEIIALMDGETGSGTWLTAEEAIEFGLADEYTPEAKKPLEVAARVAPGIYNYKGYKIDLTGFDKAAEILPE